jgi:hypothetical protein
MLKSGGELSGKFIFVNGELLIPADDMKVEDMVVILRSRFPSSSQLFLNLFCFAVSLAVGRPVAFFLYHIVSFPFIDIDSLSIDFFLSLQDFYADEAS